MEVRGSHLLKREPTQFNIVSTDWQWLPKATDRNCSPAYLVILLGIGPKMSECKVGALPLRYSPSLSSIYQEQLLFICKIAWKLLFPWAYVTGTQCAQQGFEHLLLQVLGTGAFM